MCYNGCANSERSEFTRREFIPIALGCTRKSWRDSLALTHVRNVRPLRNQMRNLMENKHDQEKTQVGIAAESNSQSLNVEATEAGTVKGVNHGTAANEHYIRKEDDSQTTEAFDNHFGVCPICGTNNGWINIGRGHWFYCKEHKVSWFAGSNLFSSWRYETEAEQMAQYDELDFGSFREIDSKHAKKLPIPKHYSLDTESDDTGVNRRLKAFQAF